MIKGYEKLLNKLQITNPTSRRCKDTPISLHTETIRVLEEMLSFYGITVREYFDTLSIIVYWNLYKNGIPQYNSKLHIASNLLFDGTKLSYWLTECNAKLEDIDIELETLCSLQAMQFYKNTKSELLHSYDILNRAEGITTNRGLQGFGMHRLAKGIVDFIRSDNNKLNTEWVKTYEYYSINQVFDGVARILSRTAISKLGLSQYTFQHCIPLIYIMTIITYQLTYYYQREFFKPTEDGLIYDILNWQAKLTKLFQQILQFYMNLSARCVNIKDMRQYICELTSLNAATPNKYL